MSDLRTAAQALVNQWESNTAYPFGLLVDNLRAALAQPIISPEIKGDKAEPVAYLWQHSETGRTRIIERNFIWTASDHWIYVGPLYAHPPQRKPLTEEKIDVLARAMVKGDRSVNWLCRVIEAEHGIEGTE